LTNNSSHLTHRNFRIDDVEWIKEKMLYWTARYNIFCFLDNQSYTVSPQQVECLLAAGAGRFIIDAGLEGLDQFIKEASLPVFGHLSYDLKEEIHGGHTRKNPVGFPVYHFFEPEVLLELIQQELRITADDPEAVYQELINVTAPVFVPQLPVPIQQRLSREAYLQKIRQLQDHILRGDCYEINFCQEFYAEEVTLDPLAAYSRLRQLSPNPFSAFYRLDDKYLLCASPERFLTRTGATLISQPIKGTIERDPSDAQHDEALRQELSESAKDRSENVMVVDLVRNDLTRICEPGSVKVKELFGIYSFPQVHQMISTITGTIMPDKSFSEILRATFPMGSMTGAPKHRVMELIEESEDWGRGIFSGSVGYIRPDGDFDFNVVIRSIMYNATTGYLSYQVGSGITFYSDPEKEWEECLLKAAAIKKVLSL
jgi:para-aminobenzoate synthetase component 1